MGSSRAAEPRADALVRLWLLPGLALLGVALLAAGLAFGTLIQTDYTDPWQVANYLLSLRPTVLLAGGLCLGLSLLLWELDTWVDLPRVGLAVAIIMAGAVPVLHELEIEAEPQLHRWVLRARAWEMDREAARAFEKQMAAQLAGDRRRRSTKSLSAALARRVRAARAASWS